MVMRLNQAFAAQAKADMDAYYALCGTSLPINHRLHYLQMWFEKLCKAYLWLPDSAMEEFRYKHNVVSTILPRLVLEKWRRIGMVARPDVSEIRRVCREVDLLHPQVDDEQRRPDNVEYPWVDKDGNALVPSEWSFALAKTLHTNPGRLVLKAASTLSLNPELLIGPER
jgi:hypothetical protein